MPGLRTKVGTYAAALYLLKDTFKESVDDPDMFEKEFMKYLKEEGVELDDDITVKKGIDLTAYNSKISQEEKKLTDFRAIWIHLRIDNDIHINKINIFGCPLSLVNFGVTGSKLM